MKLGLETDQALADLGLSSNDLRAYAALLELGRSGATIIAKRAGLRRTTVYPVLDRLEALGLAGRECTAGAVTFVATEATALVQLAVDRHRQTERTLRATRQLAEALQKKEGREALRQSKVQVFEGRKAVLAMLREQSDAWRESLMAGNRTWYGFQDDTFFKHYGEWVQEYWERHSTKSNAKLERVCLFSNESEVDTALAKTIAKLVPGQRETKPLPSGIRLNSGIWVVGEYVVVIRTVRQPHVVMVFRDVHLAENLAQVFGFLWEKSE